MSRQDPTSQPTEATQYRSQLIELDRGSRTRPELRWIALEDPDQSFLLRENDYILDSHFNPEYDLWEVLIRLEPTEEE